MSSSSAHTYHELEEMLKSFRCQDLANLLSYAGQSKNGKKSELYDRCINILKKGNPTIQIKIKEIYNNKLSTSSINNYNSFISNINSNSNSGSSSPDPSMLNRYPVGSGPSATSSSSSSSSSSMPPIYSNSFSHQFSNNGIPAASSNGAYAPHTVINTRSNSFAIGNANFGANSNVQLKVQFEKLAFFQFLHELYSPSKLQNMTSNPRQYSSYFNFFMTIDQANEITGTREMIVGKLEYSKQIHLRFGFFEPSVQVDNLPPNLIVNVNGRPAPLPAPKPTSKPNADIIRPGRSIDVTSLCRLAPNIPNKVEIQWTNPDPSKQYCVGVYVFRKVSVSSLVEHLKKNCVKDAELTRNMVREKLQITDTDLEIETDTLKVSLHCPLMKTRLQLPGRSYKCKHVQCFELESYLMMNEKKPTWNCPVCDQHAPYDDLIIDALNQEILAKCTDAEEVVFVADGSWSKVVEQDKLAPPLKSKKDENGSKKPTTTSAMDDDEPCVELCDSPPPVKRNNSTNENTFTAPSVPPQTNSNNNNNKKQDDDIIDLTCDSDEEMPLQQQQQQTISRPNGISNSNNQIRSVSRSSSNSSGSIYQNQSSTEAQASSSDSNPDSELNRNNNNSNINSTTPNNKNKNNNNNNKINDKEISNPPTNANPSVNGTSNLSPTQSIISISSNSSVLDDHSRSQTPTNLDQLNTNANNIITNISKLFQNDALQMSSRPGTASSSSSSTITSSSVPMDTTPTLNSVRTPPTTTTPNSVLSNSQLARGLSAPSPTRESMSISPQSSHSNSMRPSSSTASLNSIPNILDNLNRNSAMSPTTSTASQASKMYSPSSKLPPPAQHSPVQQPKKLPALDAQPQQQMLRQNVDERLIKPPQLIASPQQQQQQQQRLISNSNNNSSKPTNMPQRPNEHSLINQNKLTSVNKPHKKPEYLTKEKAMMVNEELKSMQSNPSANMIEQNYKNRPSSSVVVNPNMINKVRPVQQTQQQNSLIGNNQKMPHRSSTDADHQMSSSTSLPSSQVNSNQLNNKNTHLLNKPTNPASNQMNSQLIKPPTLQNNSLAAGANKIQVPQQQQPQRPTFDPNRPGNVDPLRKQLNAEQLQQQQQQRNFNNNLNSHLLNNSVPKAKPSNTPNMQHHPQQQQPKQLIPSSQTQQLYRNSSAQMNPVQSNINSSAAGSKQSFNPPSNSNRPMNTIQQNFPNQQQQMNYQKSMSYPAMSSQPQQAGSLPPPPPSMQQMRAPYPLNTPLQGNFLPSSSQHHLQMQQQLRHQQQQQQQQHAHQH